MFILKKVVIINKLVEDVRREILDNSLEILKENGYKEFNIRKVASVCGISVGTIYNYFPSKENILTQLMVNFWDSFINEIDKIMVLDCDFYRKLEKVFIELDGYTKEFMDLYVNRIMLGSRKIGKESENKENEYMGIFAERIKKCIDTEKKNGNISPLIESEIASKFILSNMMGLISMPLYDYKSFEKIVKVVLC